MFRLGQVTEQIKSLNEKICNVERYRDTAANVHGSFNNNSDNVTTPMNVYNVGNAGSVTSNRNISSGSISSAVSNNNLNPDQSHSSGNTMHDFYTPPTSAPRTGLPTYLFQEITHPIFDNNGFTNPHHSIRDMDVVSL